MYLVHRKEEIVLDLSLYSSGWKTGCLKEQWLYCNEYIVHIIIIKLLYRTHKKILTVECNVLPGGVIRCYQTRFCRIFHVHMSDWGQTFLDLSDRVRCNILQDFGDKIYTSFGDQVSSLSILHPFLFILSTSSSPFDFCNGT